MVLLLLLMQAEDATLYLEGDSVGCHKPGVSR